MGDDENRRRAQQITAVIFDVDGVLTDGSIMLDASGAEIKRFNVHDGSGLKYLRRSGFALALVSGRESGAVAARADEVGIKHVYQGYKDKIEAYEDLKRRLGLEDERIAYVGDDLTDIPIMRRCGLAAAVADARVEVKAAAHLVTEARGGAGAAREFAEWLLKATGRWDGIMSRYLGEGR